MNLCIHPEYILTKSLVIGCGNRLFGDDGFGPEIIKTLQDKNFNLHNEPENIESETNSDSTLFFLLDAGTSVREVLFNIMLSDTKPMRIIIIDAVDKGGKHGE
jgi:coenzyme F420 hydrogenase subunit delta